jgi:pimeloyl-ACP methyl ester carboxylesterase
MCKNFFQLTLISILFFVLVFFTKDTNAFEFEKIQDNPLSVSYIDNYTNQLQANIFKENDVYKGIFVVKRVLETYYSLGYFESTDGINWQMKKEILNTGVDLSNPSILKTQTGYILFISRYDNNAVYRIYSSVCDFDFNCSSNFIQIVNPDTNNYSEKNGVFAGRPLQQNGRTYLFFGAWGGDGFKIKLAYSDNLITWQRCPDDKGFLYGGDGPFPYIADSNIYLFFHSSDSSGIKLAKSTLPLNCDSVFEDQGYLLTRDKNYDQKHLIFPSVLNDNGNVKLYYSGLGNDSQWRLNLASLMPTSTPTLTPIPEKIPVVIIPGLMTSWNKEVILHNQTVDYSAWKLQNFIKDYDGLINTFKNIGYQKEVDLFLFPYNWLQPIEKTTNDLNNYLQEKIWNDKPNQKINLVGHSLGGLVARIFAQKNIDKINKIISVGSPHQGVVQVYKPLEAGEIDRDNTFLWLAEKIVLILNKSTVESDRVTIANKFPVAKDLFPTFNFLKDSRNNEISIDNLTIKNSFLTSYDQNFSDIFPIFTAIYGEKDNTTPSGFVVDSANVINQVLGNYSDGQPKSSLYGIGDYTVLSNSANQDQDSIKLDLDHGEIITKKDAIKNILHLLNVNFADDQIIEGQKTIISPSLIFMIKSPATMTVEFNNSIYIEDEGIVFIPDAKSGNYNLKVKGVNKGKYEIIIGQISENNDLWERIDGEIIQSPAESQIDNYFINYNNQTALSIFPISPTVIPTIVSTATAIPTPTQAYLTPTITPTIVLQSTNSNFSSNDQSTPEILGISSRQKESIIPKIKTTKEKMEKPQSKNSSSIWDYVWPPTISIMLGGIAYIFRKKILKNEKI